jgi:16S rRNA (uracil1498-N3)-methyltransferase
MGLQLYFIPILKEGIINLPSHLSHHLSNVLRMKVDEKIILTDGNGQYSMAEIKSISKKDCVVQVNNMETSQQKKSNISIGISFTKNASRMEWLLEKITEIGIANIYPIITERSEKFHFKNERFNKIIESAMCQSMQYYLPILHEPISLEKLIISSNHGQKFIAHCIENESKTTLQSVFKTQKPTLILIGPEGDFTPHEIEKCLQKDFVPTSLGKTRLRTETAGLVGVTILNSLAIG